MGRAPCCDKVGLKRGPWTSEEDEKLASYIKQHGHGSWRSLPQKAGLLRCGKSCRLRWTNYLRPDIRRGEFSAAEEQNIIQLHALLGNRWSAIATQLPKRTDNEIKNHWNTHLKKRLVKLGIDPATHKPIMAESSNLDTPLLGSSNDGHCSSSSLSHTAQWETARLEAEARLKNETILRAKGLWHQARTSSSSSSSSNSSARGSWSLQSDPPLGDRSCKLDCSTLISAMKDRDGVNPSTKQSKHGDGGGLSTTELINTVQNWEYSLQGQAGLMWPESWRLWKKDGSMQGQEASSVEQQLCHGSPRSTLFCLDQMSGHLSPTTRKLSWSESLPRTTCIAQEPSRSICSNSTSESFPDVGLLDRCPKTEISKGSLATSLQCVEDPEECNGVSDYMGRREKTILASNTPEFRSFLLDELELLSEAMSSTTNSSHVSSKLTTEDYLDYNWDIVLQDCPSEGEMNLQGSIYF